MIGQAAGQEIPSPDRSKRTEAREYLRYSEYWFLVGEEGRQAICGFGTEIDGGTVPPVA